MWWHSSDKLLEGRCCFDLEKVARHLFGGKFHAFDLRAMNGGSLCRVFHKIQPNCESKMASD